MPRLTEDVKRLIVTELACYRTPSEIVAAVKETFGVEVTRQQVHAYNPKGVRGYQVAPKWRELFKTARERFLEDVSAVPIAHKAYRLRQINDMAMRAKERGNMPLAAQLIEQAAKECGDYFTNRHKLEHTGKNGSSVLQVFFDSDAAKGGHDTVRY